mgnify:CR=1 FL=1
MYNEFAKKHYKGKWPCTTDSLYNEKTLIGRLHKYFSAYFETFSAPSAEMLFLLILSTLALESAHSIRFLYRHFLSGITTKSLNAFYYACSYAKVDCSGFMNVTAKIALHLIPESLKSQPVFICIDDTMVSKFGLKFENVSRLFDHAAHNGSNYLNGHCFVSLMLCIPVWNHDKISYLAVPLGYHMWQKKESKLELAASMVRQVMPEFFLEHARFLLMLHQQPESEEPNACFLARYRPKNCRFSVHGRNLHL